MAGFAMAVWVTNGAGVATDSDPNSAPPAANRIVVIGGPGPARSMMQRNLIGLGTARVLTIGGTSCVVQMWIYDNTVALWVKVGGPSTITTGTSNLGSPGPGGGWGGAVGAQMFMQITTNTGAVTHIGYDFL